MNDLPSTAAAPVTDSRSVQSYIDERPVWVDGTAVRTTPMTAMQWRIWLLAAFGKFFEGLVVFMTGVAMPLIGQEFQISAFQHGLVGAASLAGILVGAVGLGGLADQFGRRAMFIAEMLVFLTFLCLVVAAQSFWWLVICLFGMGLALGCDYPTAHMMISESIPSAVRGRLVLLAFSFQALGALVGTVVGYVVMKQDPSIDAWRWMYATAIVPGVIVALFRFGVTESAPWLLHRGAHEKAAHALRRLLTRKPPYPRHVHLKPPAAAAHHHGYAALFKGDMRRATILAEVPWFLQDLGTYGIFTPTILAASVGHKTEHVRNLADLISNDELAARGAAMIDLLLIVGIIAAVLLADRVGRIWLQIIGFIGCAAGLLIAAASATVPEGHRLLLIAIGFMLFNFMTNLGPNAQTYLIAGEVFPTRLRGKGAGFAASFAKIGAVTTAFLFPVLLKDIGTEYLLCLLAATSIAGAAVTFLFRIETAGVDLESIGH